MPAARTDPARHAFLRRHAVGVRPVTRRKTRAKWPWSQKPSAAAISASDDAPSASIRRAWSMRARTTNACGVSPVCAWKTRAKWKRLMHASAASASSVSRAPMFAST
jgi:hypothetical protein